MSILNRLLKDSFGVETTTNENPVTTTVGTTATKIAKAHPDRVGLIILNTGSVAMTLAPTNQVSATRGFQIGAGGGGVALIWDRDFSMVADEWHAVVASGTTSVYVIEVLGLKKD